MTAVYRCSTKTRLCVDRLPLPKALNNIATQGLRHADENGGGGTETRRQRNQDFLQRVTHTKNRKLNGFGPLFS